MPTGIVKWFNEERGYGFIERADGGKDDFVHISAVEEAGLDTLDDGEKISYDLEPTRNGKTAAVNLVIT